MSKLLRYYAPGQIYFVTSVTHLRKPILIEHSDLMMKSLATIEDKLRFELNAWAIMPDHFHLLINPKNLLLSDIIKRLKLSFAFLYREHLKIYRERVWQNRFWDHIIRDQQDWNNHVDYIHYNPVKHGQVKSPLDWKFSSFHNYYENGYYSRDWGMIETMQFDGDYGE